MTETQKKCVSVNIFFSLKKMKLKRSYVSESCSKTRNKRAEMRSSYTTKGKTRNKGTEMRSFYTTEGSWQWV